MDALQQHPSIGWRVDEERALKCQLVKELRREEFLWRQKSRVTWLTTPDLNTRFFHLSAIVQRRRNAIDALRTGDGLWLENRDSIGSYVVQNFQSLFCTTSTSFPRGLNDLIPLIITPKGNI